MVMLKALAFGFTNANANTNATPLYEILHHREYMIILLKVMKARSDGGDTNRLISREELDGWIYVFL
jgi:hypothetical protein